MNCSICNREVPEGLLEDHHLVPQQLEKRNKYRDLPFKATIPVCSSCGDYLHKKFSLKELAETYNTLESIIINPDVQNWIKWINKRPDDFNICMKHKKKR